MPNSTENKRALIIINYFYFGEKKKKKKREEFKEVSRAEFIILVPSMNLLSF